MPGFVIPCAAQRGAAPRGHGILTDAKRFRRMPEFDWPDVFGVTFECACRRPAASFPRMSVRKNRRRGCGGPNSGLGRHPRASGDPSNSLFHDEKWIPAFAGMTAADLWRTRHSISSRARMRESMAVQNTYGGKGYHGSPPSRGRRLRRYVSAYAPTQGRRRGVPERSWIEASGFRDDDIAERHSAPRRKSASR